MVEGFSDDMLLVTELVGLRVTTGDGTPLVVCVGVLGLGGITGLMLLTGLIGLLGISGRETGVIGRISLGGGFVSLGEPGGVTWGVGLGSSFGFESGAEVS